MQKPPCGVPTGLTSQGLGSVWEGSLFPALLLALLHVSSPRKVADVGNGRASPHRRGHGGAARRPGRRQRGRGWLSDYATNRDPNLRERIILANLGLADRLADRYRHCRGTTPEDLRQTARAGLIAAVDRYDPDYGDSFVAYAVACVAGELKRHLRDTSWRLHVPRSLKEQALGLCQAADQLQQTLGRSPSISELAQRLQVAEEQVLEALAVAQRRQERSLDRPLGDNADSCLGDLVAAPAPCEETEDLRLLPGLVAELPEPDRTVIVLRFFHDLSQDEIATQVGYSCCSLVGCSYRTIPREATWWVERPEARADGSVPPRVTSCRPTRHGCTRTRPVLPDAGVVLPADPPRPAGTGVSDPLPPDPLPPWESSTRSWP